MFDLVSFIPRAVAQSIPLLYGSVGETLTQKSGNLNLGLPGVMYVGSICGVDVYKRQLSGSPSPWMNCWTVP